MVRVLKLQLEANLGCAINVTDPIMKWLARWAAMLLSRFRVSAENKTAYEKQTGRRCKQEVVPFAEKVWFRKLSNDGPGRSKLSSKWEEGKLLGHCRNPTRYGLALPTRQLGPGQSGGESRQKVGTNMP